MRLLKASEIEARVQIVTQKGYSLLLYKDARVDMKILDEEFGPMGWQRSHQLIGDRLYCTVSIYDKENNQWVSKQDVGTEAFTEKEKSLASDSFKRACTNWGIGRELYTVPFVWINDTTNIEPNKKKQGSFVLKNGIKHEVIDIKCNDDNEIVSVKINVKDNYGNVLSTHSIGGQKNNNTKPKPQQENNSTQSTNQKTPKKQELKQGKQALSPNEITVEQATKLNNLSMEDPEAFNQVLEQAKLSHKDSTGKDDFDLSKLNVKQAAWMIGQILKLQKING